MGGILSYLFGAQPDTTPDPATGLSPHDKELIRRSWAVITERKVLKKNAVEFMLQLFQTYPDVQNQFEIFKGEKISEMRSSAKMRAHATSVFFSLSSYVENLDDTETLVALVQKIATAHVKRHNVDVTAFEKVRKVFGPYLKSILGAQCTQEVEEAWDKLLKVHNSLYKQQEDEINNGTK